ncbi:MAG TPA: radical SAM protein [Candidatus Omnitrophota bacterium]|nr:radical SAM protein [Candidatus Omnitrophota bacterium]
MRGVKKVLLLNPFMYDGRIHSIGVDPVVSRHAGQEIKTGVTFPIGLAYLGAVLKRAGLSVTILDPMAQKMTAAYIRRCADRADAIIMPYSMYHRRDTAAFLGSYRDKLRVLCGEIAPIAHAEIFGQGIADVIINGEPELTVVQVCAEYPRLESVAGILWRDTGGAVHENPDRALIDDLDQLPFPLRDFAPPELYWDISFFHQPTAWILPDRGCPYNCIFCAQRARNKGKVRRRSVRSIVDEISAIVRDSGVRNFLFFNETFNLDASFVKGLCSEILGRSLRIRWICSARPDLVTRDVLSIMKKSGCIELRYGLESANDEILSYLGKNTTVQKIREGIDLTRSAGIPFSLQCIFGSPMESDETIGRTMKFVRAVKPRFVSFNVLSPLPGSMLFEQVRAQHDPMSILEDCDILHTKHTFGQYSQKELSRIIRRAYRQHYFSGHFIILMLTEMIRYPYKILPVIRTLFVQARYLYRSIFTGTQRG